DPLVPVQVDADAVQATAVVNLPRVELAVVIAVALQAREPTVGVDAELVGLAVAIAVVALSQNSTPGVAHPRVDAAVVVGITLLVQRLAIFGVRADDVQNAVEVRVCQATAQHPAP